MPEFHPEQRLSGDSNGRLQMIPRTFFEMNRWAFAVFLTLLHGPVASERQLDARGWRVFLTVQSATITRIDRLVKANPSIRRQWPIPCRLRSVIHDGIEAVSRPMSTRVAPSPARPVDGSLGRVEGNSPALSAA